MFSRKARRELFWILFSLCCFPLMYFMIFGNGGLINLREYQKELVKSQLANNRLRQEHNLNLQKIYKLKTDSHEIERIAREHYNLARPGDIIINLQNKQ